MNNKIIDIINNTNWIPGTSRNMPLFVTDIIIKGYSQETDFMKGFRLRNLFYIYYNDFHKSFRDEKDMDLFAKKLSQLKLDKFLIYHQKEAEEESALFKEINSNKEKILDFNKEKLVEFLEICNKNVPKGLRVLQYPIFVSILKEKGKLDITDEKFIELNKLRDKHAKSAWSFVDEVVPLLIKKITEFVRITEKQAGCMTADEMIDSLRKGKLLISVEELNKRNELAVIVQTSERRYIFTGDSAKEYKDLFNKKQSLSLDVLNGNPCYPGKLQGKICKINDQRELDKIRDGDILVTYMTTVHFTPCIDKIKAILTEEGGYTCHAVILAREFQKPCITGIKGIMDFIKDGDLVEVDANKGIVRKL
jgi:phosphohistidine swiveling domain-containing protein